MKTIITIGGTKEFTDYPTASKHINKFIKTHKLDKDKLVVYGYEDSSELNGAYAVAKTWAEKSNVEFRSGQVKNGSGDTWNLRKAERDKALSDSSVLLINLRIGSKNGGKGFIETFQLKGVPVEFVDLAPSSTTTPVKEEKLTPSQKRKGEVPSKEAVQKSVAIYSKVAQKLLDHRSLMLDTETTGLGQEDEVVEIAIGDCKSGVIIFESLVKPSVAMNVAASKANGITDSMLENAPSIAEIWEQVDAIVGNRVVLASHSTSETEWFDERLLNQSLAKHGLTCSFIWKDLQPLYRLYSCQLNAKEYPLKTEGMCIQLGVEAGTHRAKNDVLAQIRILQAMADGVIPNFEV